MAHARYSNNMELGAFFPNSNAGYSELCVNGVHPDGLDGYPVPIVDCLTYPTQSLNGHTAGTNGYFDAACGPVTINKPEPFSHIMRGAVTVAGVKRKWLDAYNEGSAETHVCGDALVCGGVENCLPDVEAHCEQVKVGSFKRTN